MGLSSDIDRFAENMKQHLSASDPSRFRQVNLYLAWALTAGNF